MNSFHQNIVPYDLFMNLWKKENIFLLSYTISINTFALFNWKPGQNRNIPARNWNNWWLDPTEPDQVAHSPTSESIFSINYLSYYTMNGINRVCFRRIYNFITMKN